MDAYTLRKLAPRILIGVIGINLSIYLCLAVSDIVVIVGNGLGSLLTAPFVTADSYDFGIKGNVSNNLALLGGAGIFVGAGGLGAVVGGVASLATAPLATLGSLILLMIPIALVALGVLITIVIRQALLVFLIIVSPVAIALFVIPNTERYFRQWWDLFLKTLLVYPIIAAIFAMSDVFGSIIFRSAASGGGASGVVKIITGILVIYAPLFLIPFAFRIAGGAIGQVANMATTGARRMADMGFIKGRRDIAKQQLQHGMVQQRADIAGRLKDSASRERGFIGRHVGNRARRGLAGSIGGYNIESQASAMRAEKSKILNEQINTGRDEEIRGLTVNKGWADQHGAEGEDWRVNNGVRQYKSLVGKWINEADVLAGHSRWGNDTYAQQAALSYEMRKANSDEEVGRISTRYADLATGPGGWGMSDGQARGAFIGAGFENQNRHLEFKYTDAMTGNLNYDGFVDELYHGRGSYNIAQMSPHTIRQLMRAYNDPNATPQRREEIADIAESFVQRGGAGGTVTGMEGEGERAEPQTIPQSGVQVPQQGPAGETARVYASGAGHTNQAIRELAHLTGRLDAAPNSPYGDPGRSNTDPGSESNPGAPQN